MQNKKEGSFIRDFYLLYADSLYENDVFRKQILSVKNQIRELSRDTTSREKEIFKKILNIYLEEAELTLSLIREMSVTKKDSLLEVGGGFGLVYAFLKKRGYENTCGIEPCGLGFEGYFTAATELFQIVGVDGSHFYPFLAQETEKINKKFDIIFSNNVLEHIPELEESIVSLKHSLTPHGMMIHNTINYFIPYDPHLQIVLFPFFPKLTEWFIPSLKQSAVWNGISFITTSKLKRVCSAHNLKIEFKKDRLQKTFMRLETDPNFAKRQKYFTPVYKILKFTGLLKFLHKIPSALTTPITFTITKIS